MSTLNVSNITDGTTTVGTSYVVNGSAKAWVNFNGTGTIAVRDSLNVASITDNGTGITTVSYSSAMASENYNTALGQQRRRAVLDYGFMGSYNIAAGSMRVNTINAASTLIDYEGVDLCIQGELA
jgi:type IV secretory pathway component VirB8